MDCPSARAPAGISSFALVTSTVPPLAETMTDLVSPVPTGFDGFPSPQRTKMSEAKTTTNTRDNGNREGMAPELPLAESSLKPILRCPPVAGPHPHAQPARERDLRP